MLKKLSPIQKAYVAGFLDGDGSIYVRAKPNPTYRYGFQIAPYIVLFQSGKCREDFEAMCAAIGYGKMRERKDGILEYTINRIDAIKEFLGCVQPFVILKRRQVELMLKIIKAKSAIKNRNDFSALLALIDAFAELNYSKKRKRRVLTP
jgi:hypothetical protein